MTQKNKNPKKLSLFDRLLWRLAQPMLLRRLEAIYDAECGEDTPEKEPPERPMYTLGDCIVYARVDESPDQFSERIDRVMEETARKYSPDYSLEGLDKSLARVEAEIERMEGLIEFYEGEIAGLQDHADWLTGQAAKLRAERIRLEAEGRAAIEAVEEMYGISSGR